MDDIPKIRIELDGVKSSVTHMFRDHNNALTEAVTESINTQLTEEWVKLSIDKAVKDCINKAIDGVANSHELKQTIRNSIVDIINESLNDRIKT